MEFAETFKFIAEQMTKELEFIKLGPNQLKGRSREIVLRRFLKPFVPIDLDICNGVVISTQDKSGEIDLIIYDKKGFSLFKPFFEFYPEDTKPIPVETVYLVIEVENWLDKEKTIKCMEKIKKVKELQKVAYYEQSGAMIRTFKLYGKEWKHFPTLGIIFAFDGNVNEIIEVVTQANYPLEHKVDLICVLQKGLITYYNPETNLLNFPPEPSSKLGFKKGPPEENLRIFYLMLTHIFSQAWMKPIRVLDYFQV